MSATVEVLGLGNSLVDILAYADDDYLSAQEMVKGAMNLIDEDRAEALYAARVDPRVISGGSAANTIVGVASFGVPAAYIGKVKRDPLGAAFADDIRSTGVAFATAPAEHGPATGRCFIYVTPDGERTMNTYLGASSYLAPPDVDEALVKAAKVVYLEGYMWDRPGGQNGVPEGGRDRPRRRTPGCADALGFVLRRPVPRRIHRSHALEDRRYDLRQHRRDPVAVRDAAFRRGARQLRAEGVLGIVTRSEKGCVVVEKDQTWEAPAFPIAKLIDTTGAGDMFAAGFLAGLARGRDMVTCGRLGALAAAEIIQHLGARPNVSLAELARQNGLTV